MSTRPGHILQPNELSFAAPTSVQGALAELDGAEAVVVGGGTSVALLLKNHFLDVERLVYIGRIRDISGMRVDDAGTLRIGATSTLREIGRSPLIRSSASMLAVAASHVGNPRVRAVATLGGAAIHGDPRQDIPPVLLALGARVQVASLAGSREIAASELFLGWMETAVGTGELLTAVIIPDPSQLRGVYVRYCPGTVNDYPTVGVAAAVSTDPDGLITDARIAIAGVASTALLMSEAAQTLLGTTGDAHTVAAVADACADVVQPVEDRLGSVGYKRTMTQVWVRRALAACLAVAAEQ